MPNQELDAAKDELAHLEETAKSLAADLRQLADWIESAATPDFLEKMEIQQKQNKLSSEDNSDHYSEALNFKSAAEIVALVTKARNKVENLQQRLASLVTK